MQQPRGDIAAKPAWGARDLTLLPEPIWEIPYLLLRRGVVMISGPKSSLKSYIVLALGLAIVYALTWFDGTKLVPGLFYYVTGEDEKRVGRRRIAWLRAHNQPETDQDGFRVLNLHHDDFPTAAAWERREEVAWPE